MMEVRIIGCGAMGSAIAKGLAQSNIPLSLYDKHSERAKDLAHEIGKQAKVCSNPHEDFDGCLLIAVKPNDFEKAANELKEFRSRLVVSIIAGMKVERLQKAFPNIPCLQMMPNLAAAYGKGCIALIESPEIKEHKLMIEKLFAPLGYLYWIPEKLLDGATALTGSGPAFAIAIIEAMVDAAIAMGFSSEQGYRLAQEMLSGTLSLLNGSDGHPSSLRWQITSPQGTTIAGLRTFEDKNVRSGIIETFLSAARRSRELQD